MDAGETVADVQEWFSQLETPWYLTFSHEGAICWAELRRSDNPDAVLEQYGKGSDELSAAQSAKQRWTVEQLPIDPARRERRLP